MARRFAAGIGQLSLALVGFALTVAWFSLTMVQTYNQISDDAPAKSFGWLGAAGALVFAVSWLWALATSLSLLRQAKADEQANRGDVPPRITNPPDKM